MSQGQLLVFPSSSEAPSRRRLSTQGALFRRRQRLEEDLGRTPPDSPPEPARSRQGSLIPLLSLLFLGVVALGIALSGGRGSVGDLPVAARAELYAQTIASLKTACIPPRSWSPSDYCVTQIRTVLAFPDCGPECRALVQQAGHRPMK